MTHAERLRFLWREYEMFPEYRTALLAGADALDKLASLPHYHSCNKWVALSVLGGATVLDEARECTCPLKEK